MIFLTSDQHFWHKNVITYCGRPFTDRDHMNSELVRLHNYTVNPDDFVFMLGDFCFGSKAKTRQIVGSLRGRKILVRGNHDHWRDDIYVAMGFERVCDKFWLGNIAKGFWLSHFPYQGLSCDERVFETQLKDSGDWLLHGHVHHHWKKRDRMINVGVDVWGYRPVRLDQVIELAVEG